MLELKSIKIENETLRVWIDNYGRNLSSFFNQSYSKFSSYFSFVLQGWEYSTEEYYRHSNKDMFVELKPGMVDFISSRETLDFSNRTKSLINEINKIILSDEYKKEVFKCLSDEVKIDLINNRQYKNQEYFENNYIKLAEEKPMYIERVFVRAKKDDDKYYKMYKLGEEFEYPKSYSKSEALRIRDLKDIDQSENNLNLFLKNEKNLIVLYNYASDSKAVRVLKNTPTPDVDSNWYYRMNIDLVAFVEDIEKFKENIDKRFYNNIIYLDVEEEAKKYATTRKRNEEVDLELSSDFYSVENFRYSESYNHLTWDMKKIYINDVDSDVPTVLINDSDWQTRDNYIKSLGKKIELTDYKKIQIIKTKAPKAIYDNFKFSKLYANESILNRAKSLKKVSQPIEEAFDPIINKNMVDEDNIIGRCLRCNMDMLYYRSTEETKKYRTEILNAFLKNKNINFKSDYDYRFESYNMLKQNFDEKTKERYNEIEKEFIGCYETLIGFITNSIKYNIFKEGSNELKTVIKMVMN